jgi:hypothetical protein
VGRTWEEEEEDRVDQFDIFETEGVTGCPGSGSPRISPLVMSETFVCYIFSRTRIMLRFCVLPVRYCSLAVRSVSSLSSIPARGLRDHEELAKMIEQVADDQPPPNVQCPSLTSSLRHLAHSHFAASFGRDSLPWKRIVESTVSRSRFSCTATQSPTLPS